MYFSSKHNIDILYLIIAVAAGQVVLKINKFLLKPLIKNVTGQKVAL